MLDEKRHARRFPGRIGIYAKDAQGLNFGFITDLSREGAYIETQNLLPAGSDYPFMLSNGVITAPVKAKVVRSHDAFFQGGTSGVAVRFTALDGISRRLRDDLLLYLMNSRYQADWDHPRSA